MPKSLLPLLIGLFLFSLINLQYAHAQSLLDKTITVSVKEKKLGDVLSEISSKGDFYFSYDGRLVPKDSIISLRTVNQPIRIILKHLFNDRYNLEVRDNYIIITAYRHGLSLINPDLTVEDNFYSVSGIVVDELSGERLMNASVYEKSQLVSTLTDSHGYFRLKFKANDNKPLAVTVSKLLYRDTTLNFLQPVNVSSKVQTSAYANFRNKNNQVESTGIGRLFTSARQKIQSINIPDFFATRPFQASLTPGLSSHGMFSPQVVNKFSLNLAGGYTAGTDGLEFGGLFNINKQDAKYVQIAGIFNLVGGNAIGLQLAGAHNRTLDTLKGVQISLFTNRAEKQVSGVQISALHNETRKLKGLQLGLVNFADTSEGASVGLINMINNGFYKITYSANNLANTNISLKTGTHQFYTAILTSANVSQQNKLYAFGLGIGHDFMFNDRVYVSAETDYLLSYTGALDDRWLQGKLLLNVRLFKNISLLAGPTYNRYSYTGSSPGYQTKFNLPEGYLNSHSNPVKNWIGWEAGITFNSVFKPVKRTPDYSTAWYLEIAGTTGTGWERPYGLVTGGELSLHRDLGDNLVGTLSTGFTHIASSSYTFKILGDTYLYAKPMNIVPLKAGIRLKFGSIFYIAGDIGAAFGGKQTAIINRSETSTNYLYPIKNFRSLMYDVGAGFAFNSGLETGVKFEDCGLQSPYKQIALRLGYRIRLSK
jgi:hypothetical protein